MFKERLISGIVMMIIAIGAIMLGGYVLYALILGISIIGMYELYKLYHMERTVPGILGYVACVAYFLLIHFELEQYVLPMVLAFLLLAMILYVCYFPKYKTSQMMSIFFGLFYVAVMLCCIYRIRVMEQGVYLVWLVFIGSWGSDTCAYCVGRLIGKHKAFPVLSPKKSWEGCIGGVVGAGLIGFLYALIFRDKLTSVPSPMVSFAVIGAASAVISQVGDLAASAMKRDHEIKDYGHLIPGHGGILDRFDSVIFTAPIVYYLLQFIA